MALENNVRVFYIVQCDGFFIFDAVEFGLRFLTKWLSYRVFGSFSYRRAVIYTNYVRRQKTNKHLFGSDLLNVTYQFVNVG